MADLKPEERARQWIDRKLKDAGWEVINRNDFAPSMNAVAIRETLMSGGLEADYVLFLNGKAAAVIEAKREEISLDNPQLIAQAENYTTKALEWVPLWENPIPFVFLSNGKEIAFKDCRKKDAKYEKLKYFKRPWDIARYLRLNEFAGLPYLSRTDLRACQYEAITNLESSFKNGQRRALMVLATGSGKTFTACMMIYRMLSFTPMRRVLFLVDRTNLGNDAATALKTFKLTENKNAMAQIFGIEQLNSKLIKELSKEKHTTRSLVAISTIQRLYAALSGKDVTSTEKDEDTPFYQTEDAIFYGTPERTVELPESPCLPPDFFDLIIIDECHRSIYSNWQKVLTYFKTARLVGLTATPIPETVAFFNNNIVANYSYEDSVKDNVNVDFRIYRIKTQLSEEGGEIQAGDTIISTIRGEDTSKEQTAICDREFEKNKLNRSIVVPDQIRKILQEYKDVVYTQMYPNREPNYDYLPKTLIFAVNEGHAKAIVEIAKEVFERKADDDKFVQRITYSCDDTKKLIQQFRYDVDFRIAVTVTLVATGTDVRPLEVLLFLNDIRSETLYAQMKGRGCRVIKPSELRSVTPNATSKELFYIIDAVGVTESEKVMPSIIVPGDDKIPNPTLAQILEKMAMNNLSDDLFILLANKLSAIGERATPEDLADYTNLYEISPSEWAQIIFARIDKDDLPPFVSNLEDNTERYNVIRKLLENIPARHKLIEMARGYVKELPDKTDTVIFSGFSTEEAKSYTQAFKEYIQTHKDEIEALRLIYNHDVGKLTRDHIDELKSKLELSISGFTIDRLWNDYALLDKDKVKTLNSDKDAVTHLIQLVRYAYNIISELYPLTALCAQRFELWCGQAQRDVSDEQKELFRKIALYISVNGSSDFKKIISVMPDKAGSLLRNIKDRAKIEQELLSLNEFILKVA
ncbi:MAG: DEAD/DEAH box helicase family protein [Anaerobiospirillum succiniciproducens]|uniref:type I restriction endonuclease subunit R n=2 Tax=Anaerobiospirillum succiniciproducens TaxID=13335 RepID=UPI0026DC1EB4|nr:type I restriction endonuclease subunit R [Anaerobiospirillum succiniciproducens]MDO4675735.1 DEAD/DEAH box helicase family protein [Anaerobiospirillum succiniciproducens]